MTTLTELLNNPEEHYPGNFDTPERAVALLTGLCQDAAIEIDRLNKAQKWVGLTDEEIEQGCKESWVTEQAWQSAVWWAEAKLREKNYD